MKKLISILLMLIIGTMGACISEAEDEKPLGHLTKLGVEESVLDRSRKLLQLGGSRSGGSA